LFKAQLRGLNYSCSQGSPAHVSGLEIGMLIESVNDVEIREPIAEFIEEMGNELSAKVIWAEGEKQFTLTITGENFFPTLELTKLNNASTDQVRNYDFWTKGK